MSGRCSACGVKKLESAGGNEDVTPPSRKEKMQIIGKKSNDYILRIFCCRLFDCLLNRTHLRGEKRKEIRKIR